MKYAIVSDIHANLQAWKSVLIDARSMLVDKIICLGDSIGYGPNPVEVLESLHETVDYFVLGNHEAALCGKIDENTFNDHARNLIVWTRARLSGRAVKFLADHPLMLAGSGFRCAHAEFADAGRFCYMFDAEDAMQSWRSVNEQLLFVGHTHRPCIMVLGKSGMPHMLAPEDFVLEKEKRFLVNVGSIGQPRDGDTRASYCMFDTNSGSVYWRKIPFDIDAYKDALSEASISREISPFLEYDPRSARPPLREQVPFSPPAEPVQNAVKVQYVDRLKRKLRAWKIMFAVGITIFSAAAIFAGSLWFKTEKQVLYIPGSGMSVLVASDFAPGNNLLRFPVDPIEPGHAIPNWNVRLGDRYRQQAAWAYRYQDISGFMLESLNPKAELRLISSSVRVDRDMRLRLQGYVKSEESFTGNIAFALVLIEQRASDMDGHQQTTVLLETNRNFVVKEPNLPRMDGWLMAQQTITMPARAHAVILEVRGNFKGTVLVRDVSLEIR